jgi:prepilin-type N-terminal cleavage/methylation domain-containing protein
MVHNFKYQTGKCAGFTLIELLTVIVIIGIIFSSITIAYQHARTAAWKEKARDTARQLATAWNLRLQDDREWPATSANYQTVFDSADLANNDLTFQTTPANMSLLGSTNNPQSKIYFDQNADQRANGLRDHWGNLFSVRLDLDYDGQVLNPTNGASDTAVIKANVVVWSTGPKPGVKEQWVVAW